MDIQLESIHPMQSPTIGLYGAGGRAESAYRDLVEAFPSATVVVFDTYKQGSFNGQEIHTLDSYETDSIDFFVIASAFYREIAELFVRRGINRFLVYQNRLARALSDYTISTYPNTRSKRFIVGVEAAEGGVDLRCEPYGHEAKDGSRIAVPSEQAGGANAAPASRTFPFFDRETDYKRQLRPEQWSIATLKPGHEDFIDATFEPPSRETDVLQQANALMARIVELTKNSLGLPTAQCNALHPIDQLRAAMQGEVGLWCSNLSNILAYVCKRYGIICRTISCGNTLILGKKTLTYALGHMTTEVYCPEKEQWVWMDVSLGVFHALLYGKVYLTFYDFMRFFNSRYEDGISLNLGPDADSPEPTLVPVKAFPEYPTLVAYFNHNQRFSYTLQDPYSSTS